MKVVNVIFTFTHAGHHLLFDLNIIACLRLVYFKLFKIMSPQKNNSRRKEGRKKGINIHSHKISRNSPKLIPLIVINCILGHCRSGKIQNNNDGLLQRRDGLHPNVRYHERGVVQFGARLGNADQNVLVRQRPGDLGRQQVRHGGRKGDHHRERQAISGPIGRPVLRDVGQREYQH